jgi:hypothetical protein
VHVLRFQATQENDGRTKLPPSYARVNRLLVGTSRAVQRLDRETLVAEIEKIAFTDEATIKACSVDFLTAATRTIRSSQSYARHGPAPHLVSSSPFEPLGTGPFT